MTGRISDTVALVIAVTAVKVVVVVAVKSFGERNGEVERGEEVELVYGDFKRGDERGWTGMEIVRYVDVVGGIDQVWGEEDGEVIDTSLSRGILTASISI